MATVPYVSSSFYHISRPLVISAACAGAVAASALATRSTDSAELRLATSRRRDEAVRLGRLDWRRWLAVLRRLLRGDYPVGAASSHGRGMWPLCQLTGTRAHCWLGLVVQVH